MVVALLLGAVVGIILGAVGAGGSLLAMPALLFGLGLPFASAVPVSLMVVGASATGGILPRLKGSISWALGLIIGFAGIPSAFLGAHLSHAVNDTLLIWLFVAVMVLAGLRMLFPVAAQDGATNSNQAQMSPQDQAIRAAAIGVGVGFLTGLLGVGGGFLIVPALVIILRLPMRSAVGTSLVVIVINSLAGLIAHVGVIELDWSLPVLFAVAAVVSSILAAQLGKRIPEVHLKRSLSILILCVAAYMITMTLVA